MAKYIENKDGSRMLVSDDAPDDLEIIESSSWNKPEQLTVVDPVVVLLAFKDTTFPLVPVQLETFGVQGNKTKITGTMLLSDYAWLLENIKAELARCEIQTQQRVFIVSKGPLRISRFVGKDINAATATVHLSLNQHI